MKGIKLDPAKLCQELTDFNRSLINSYQTLQQIKEIDVDQTPHEIVYTQDKLSLRYYRTQSETAVKTPLLICYALVNRPYMIDLQPDRSLLLRLLEAGHDIYLIDWGYPDAADRYLDLDDYINEYLNNCVDFVLNHARCDQTNLLGICQGGTFSLCYTALNPDKIKNLITMVTPVDFHTPDNLLSHLAQQVDTDLAVETYGNIPGEMLNDSYNSLMPMRLGVQKNLGMPRQFKTVDSALSFLRMEHWIYDSPDQAGEAFRQFVGQFFQQNLLVKGEAQIGEYKVDLKRIKQPVLNIYGSHDHLVPPSASIPLGELISSTDYQPLEIKAGHIGVFVSSKAQTITAPSISEWLTKRD